MVRPSRGCAKFHYIASLLVQFAPQMSLTGVATHVLVVVVLKPCISRASSFGRRPMGGCNSVGTTWG